MSDEIKTAEEKKGEDAQSTAPAATPESSVDETVEVPEKFKKFVEQIETMSVLELHELVKIFEKRFGVSASAVAPAAPGAGGDAGAETPSTVSVELTDAGAQKIQVIKAVKEVLGLGLKEAKDLVDAAPSMLKEGIKKEEAEELKAKLEAAGATVGLK